MGTLWVEWRHQGDLTAECASEVYQLPPEKFKCTMQIHPRPWLIATLYAQGFHRFLLKANSAEYNDFIRDDEFPRVCINEIKSALSTRLSRYEVKHPENESSQS